MQPTPVESVINPKSLERQIKLLDERLAELKLEVDALERKREACHVLLGVPLSQASAEPLTPKKAPPRKKREADAAELPEGDILLESTASENEIAAASH